MAEDKKLDEEFDEELKKAKEAKEAAGAGAEEPAEDSKQETEMTGEAAEEEKAEQKDETNAGECGDAETCDDTKTEKSDAEADEAAEEAESPEPKKKFLKGRKDKKDEEIAALKDKVARQMAEFDNFRKRTEREKSQMYDNGARSIIEKVLPVVDNFERGLATIDEKDKDSPLAEGMEKIYKQFESLLSEAGVEKIEAEGKQFDPEFHNAVMHVEDEKFGENVVSQELQKGYMYHGTVVRHTMVVVAN